MIPIDIKCAVGPHSPNSAKRVGPCASQSSWTRTGSSRAASNQRNEGACENKSENALDFHGAYAASKQFNASSSDHLDSVQGVIAKSFAIEVQTRRGTKPATSSSNVQT
jgi:hypothetical protein